MASDFIPVLFLMLLAAVVACAIPIISSLLGRRRPNEAKQSTYECGVAELDSVRKRVSIKYYLTALTFIVFDIEIAFLYPWAVVLKKIDAQLFVFSAMMIFLVVIFLAYAWEWKKGALDWE